MAFLTGKKAFITGMLSNRSIAYGIAKAMAREGAELAFSYQNDRLEERTRKLAEEFGASRLVPCDVAEDASVAEAFRLLGKMWDGFDILVHSIAYAPAEALAGSFVDGCSREAFRIAHDISSFSLVALSGAARPMMKGRNGNILTLTYLGGERVVPGYNTMGLAKASLEAAVRYLASELGPQGTRVNAISAGPIRTLAASGIKGFGKMLDHNQKQSPLRRNVTNEEVGNAAAFLASDLASGITGEILYVDAGFQSVVAGNAEGI